MSTSEATRPAGAATAPLLACAGVTKRFGRTTAVDRVDLEVRPQETLSVVGPSGCGKSTLLRAVAGLTGVDEGTITLAGREVSTPGALVPPERRGVGIVFQDLALFPHLTAAENLAFGLRHGVGPGGRAAGEQRERVAAMLALVGLADKADRYPHQLSGGEQQRVALGRSLVLDPALVLLDEPFSHLDRGLAAAVRREAMETLRRAGATVVLVTHDQEEAFACADRVAVMQEGRLVQVDTPAAVFHAPATEFAASFVGEADFLAGERRAGVARTALGELAVTPGPDGPVRVLLRPHHLTAFPDDPVPGAASDATPATAPVPAPGTTGGPFPAAGARALVQDVEFRGAEVLHALRLESGETVRALLPHTAALRPGTAARVPAPAGTLVAFDG